MESAADTINSAGPSSQGHNTIPSEENKKVPRPEKGFSKFPAENNRERTRRERNKMMTDFK